MKRYFFELLALVLILGALGFFYSAIGFLARRDYVGGGLIAAVGLVVIHVGAEMARLALADRTS